MTPRRDEKAQLLTVKVPSSLLDGLDSYVRLLRAHDGEVTRTDAVRALLSMALERESSRERLRILRYMIVNAVRAVAPRGTDRAEIAEVRRHLADVPREILDRSLLDLENDGAIALACADDGSATSDGIVGSRGCLRWVSLTPLVQRRWSSITSLDDSHPRADAS
jgi:hypothetical protein